VLLNALGWQDNSQEIRLLITQQVPGAKTVLSCSEAERVKRADRARKREQAEGISPAVTVNEKAGY